MAASPIQKDFPIVRYHQQIFFLAPAVQREPLVGKSGLVADGGVRVTLFALTFVVHTAVDKMRARVSVHMAGAREYPRRVLNLQ